MSVLITGGAGFIGCHLVKELLNKGKTVVVADNLILGKEENLTNFSHNNFFFYKVDVSNMKELQPIFKQHKIDTVYHLAANSDIQKGGKEPSIDFKNTFLTTYTVLECMRIYNVSNLFFASTSAVYGEKMDIELKEDTGDLRPVSYYGSAKLASEAFIFSYSSMNNINVVIFRFPNVIGPQLTHGVVFDFRKKLIKNPNRLEILGDGKQSKPYLFVTDLINGIVSKTEEFQDGIHIYNIGVDSATTVNKIADTICEEMGLNQVQYEYSGGDRGWKGDVPSFRYNLDKIHQTGWKPQYSSDEAIRATVKAIVNGDEL